ncbi:tRNA (adenosine(37)-N6)-threonylcarbamoyltransferase complex transferase subunit TsaD [bacterium]|nr:tRNA (adenosine(37)-N6)-threonylcarbamoyltransferase complex transferase subunit TsaD [candidate division CSSED10-310 bacterium]
MIVLGIETSCDDSSAAIVRDGSEILANIVAGQDQYHQKYGGVVPEIAARKHLEHILGVIQHSFDSAGLTPDAIDAIGVTHRPGLVGSLVVGLTAAKSLAWMYRKPLIGIHHIEAHDYAACFAGMPYGIPHVALVASGGHTSLLYMTGQTLRLIGQTVDDAAGEAFDKVAKLLGFGYPGGPIIDRMAAECTPDEPGNLVFPRPMLNRPDFNFSFSGLKTAVMYHIKTQPDTPPRETARAFQDAVVDVLITKTLRAAAACRVNIVSVVGGVAANSALRSQFAERCRHEQITLYIPPARLCTDNAAMVAGLGFQKLLHQPPDNLDLGVDSHSGLSLAL